MSGPSNLPRSWSPSAATARQRKVIELLAMGKQVPQIARELAITDNAVWKLMRRALANQAKDLQTPEGFDRAKALYLLHHDAMMATWFPRAVGTHPDEKAADIVMKLMSLYADVSGLKAPVKIEPVGDGVELARPEVVALVLDRLDELAARSTPPKEIEGEVVDTQSPSIDELSPSPGPTPDTHQ